MLCLAIGNAIVFYDFVVFAFFSVQIGHALFPAASTAGNLLESLAAFGSGFLTRPLGAVLLGQVADRKGRRTATLLAFAIIGVATCGLALTPSVRRIGIAAPLLATLFRLLQGIAIGGDVGASTALLIEAAPADRRAGFVSVLAAGQDCAVLAAGLIGFILSERLSPGQLDLWGWRVALLAGAVILPYGAWLRGRLPETWSAAAPLAGPPLDTRARSVPWRVATLGLLILIAGTILTYGVDYLTTYGETALHLAPQIAFRATLVIGLCGVTCDLAGGWLADRIGRRTLLVALFLVEAIATLPAFHAIGHHGPAYFLIVSALLSCAVALPLAAAMTAIGETLPRATRARAFGLIYATAVSVFGGSTQVVIAALVSAHGAIAPAWYMTGAALLGLGAALLFPETMPGRGGRSSAG